LNLAESTLSLGQTLWLLSPELALLLTSLIVLVPSLIHPRQEQRRWPPYVALIGLGAALVATTTLWGCDTRVLAVLSCDALAVTLKCIALGATVILVLTANTYTRTHTRHRGTFYAMVLFSALAMCLLSGATNLVLILLALDLLNVASYVLISYQADDPRSTEAAIKFFLYNATLSAVFLYGLSWLYGLTGSTDLNGIAAVVREQENTLRPAMLPALIFVGAGFALKVGAVPFHQWVPDAYEGTPTPIAAFLSVGPMIGGLTVVSRVLLTALPPDLEILAMDWRTLLMAIATLTMTVGNLVALWQHNTERLLAYSSIAQGGAMLIGVITASRRGLTAMLLCLIAYLLANLGAFAAATVFSSQAGSQASGTVEDYAGLSKRAPALAFGLLVCLFSLGGVPLTAGFTGKLYLLSAAMEEGLLWLAIVGATVSIMSLACYWKIIRAMYIAPPQTEARLTVSPTLGMALGLAVVGVLAIGIFPDPLLELLQAAAQGFFGG